MSVTKFADLFTEEPEALFVAESHLLKAFPLITKYIFTKELEDVLVQQTARTKIYVNSLKSALDHLDRKVAVTRNATVDSMVSELIGSAKRYPRGNVRDAAFLAVLQRLGHHRAAGYMSTLALAKQMGEVEVLEFLRDAASFDDVSAKHLAQIAVQVNAEAFIDTHTEKCVPKISGSTERR